MPIEETADDTGGADAGGDDSGDAGTDPGGDPAARWEGEITLPADGILITGERPGDHMGGDLAIADLDGDGVVDMAVGGMAVSTGASRTGEIAVLSGPITEGGTTAAASATIRGSRERDEVGYADQWRPVGDVDGDGYVDMVVVASAPYFTAYSDLDREVHFLSGPFSGEIVLPDDGALWTQELDDSELGWMVSGGADLTGDGLADWVVTAPRVEFSGGRSRVYVMSEGPGGGRLEDAAARLEGDSVESFSSGVWAEADVTGDGVADVVVPGFRDWTGSGTRPTLLVYAGPLAGTALPSMADGAIRLDDAAELDGTGSIYMSHADVDGDGADDLLVGLPRADVDGDFNTARGELLVIGATQATSIGHSLEAQSRLVGERDLESAGREVNGMGDLDGDGYGDFVVANSSASPHGDHSGEVRIVYGPVAASGALSANVSATLQGDARWWGAGAAVAGGPDLTGDGTADLAVGMVLYPGEADQNGAILVLPGAAP